jgi:hypothetical protein
MPAGCLEFAFLIGEGNREERKKERKGICGKKERNLEGK